MVELNPQPGGLEPIKVCTELTLPTHRLHEAAQVASHVNYDNAPDSTLLQDAITILTELGAGDAELASAVLLTKKRWKPGTELTVGWFRDEWTENDKIRDKIRYYINRLERWQNIQFRFIGFNTDDAAVRISMRRGGSASYMGPDIYLIEQDQPTMWLGWLDAQTADEEYRRVAPHEALHTTGFGHEHQNPDDGLPWNLEAVYNYYRQSQGWSREQTMSQVIKRYAIDSIIGTARDPLSIMHYGVPAQLLMDPSKAVGWNDDVSERDKKFIQQIYPY